VAFLVILSTRSKRNDNFIAWILWLVFLFAFNVVLTFTSQAGKLLYRLPTENFIETHLPKILVLKLFLVGYQEKAVLNSQHENQRSYRYD